MTMFNKPFQPKVGAPQFFNSFGPPTPQGIGDVLGSEGFQKFASAQGYRQVGDQFERFDAGGNKHFMQASDLAGRYQRGQNQNGFLNQFAAATGVDLQEAERARVQNREGVNRALNRAEDAVAGVGGQIQRAGEKTAKDLEALAQRQREEFEARIGGELDRFSETQAQLESTTSAAIHRANRNIIKSFESGFSPDGLSLPPEQAQAFAAEAKIQAANDATSQLAQIGAQFAQGRLGAAVGISQQRVASQGLEAQLYTQAAQVRQAIPAAAMANELQGNLALAQFQTQYPDSPLSIANALAQIGALMTAPGIGNFGATDFGGSFA